VPELHGHRNGDPVSGRKIPVRLVKDAGIDQEDGEILGAYTWDMPGQLTMHGSNPHWQWSQAMGNLMRMGGPIGKPGEKPRGSSRPRR
jgi:hypothetical protein